MNWSEPTKKASPKKLPEIFLLNSGSSPQSSAPTCLKIEAWKMPWKKPIITSARNAMGTRIAYLYILLTSKTYCWHTGTCLSKPFFVLLTMYGFDSCMRAFVDSSSSVYYACFSLHAFVSSIIVTSSLKTLRGSAAIMLSLSAGLLQRPIFNPQLSK